MRMGSKLGSWRSGFVGLICLCNALIIHRSAWDNCSIDVLNTPQYLNISYQQHIQPL